MKTLTLNGDIYLIPGNWNEMNSKELLFLVRLVDTNVRSEEIKIKMLLHSMQAKVIRYENSLFRIKSRGKIYDLSGEELSVISGIFDYLFSEVDGQICINPMLTKNPFPHIRVGWVTLYGPADGLTDLIYDQFADLQVYQMDINGTGEGVDKFLSVIYKRKNGKQTNLVSRISAVHKTVLLWFYMGCIGFMQDRFPAVFSGSSDTTNVDVFDNQMRIIDALAKNDVTKKNEVKNALLYDALYTMEVAAEEVENMNEK